ncbi:MAG: glycosyltransferase family 2 protein [Balneolaceae bacterium]
MQEDRVQVSVIVPSYNHEQFLEERLESIFSQTWPDFEVILLDDASTDGSPEILRQHSGHPKVTAVELNQANSGSPFRQWQQGIEMARGELIWIAESDDTADPTFLERMVGLIDAGADLACCRPQKIDGEGRRFSDEIWADSLDAERWKNDFENDGLDEIRDYLCYRNTLSSASACIFRKRPGLFPETVLQSRFSGDWLFWIHYLRQGRIAYTGETLSLHRSHEETTRSLHDNENELARLQERLRAIRLARRVGGRGRIRPSEIWKYRYLIRVIRRLRSEPDPVRVAGRIPAELLFYTWLIDWRERR